MSQFVRFAYARNDADFPETLRNDIARPERASDHDMPVAYFAIPNLSPVITSAVASPQTLWPVNHKFVDVKVRVEATDDTDPTPSCSITDVSSNQPVNGTGDGNTEPDWMIPAAKIAGSRTLGLQLRAERSATLKSDRVYTIVISCADESANTTTKTVPVVVLFDPSAED
jgi:hypothetical protein